MIKRWMLRLVMVCIVSISLFACKSSVEVDEPEVGNEIDSSDNEPTITQPKPTTDPIEKEITIPVRNPNTLNPIMNTDRTVDAVLKLVFDSLFVLDDDQKPVPNLVETYSLEADGKRIMLNLRDDVYWHDGTQFSADDVVFTINSLKAQQDEVVYKSNVADITGVKKLGTLQVQIDYAKGAYENLYTLVLPVIPAHYYKNQLTLKGTANFKPIGSGSYRVVDYQNMKFIKLEKNEQWHLGDPIIDKLTCYIIKDESTNEEAFKANITDINYPELFSFRNYATREGVNLHTYTSYNYDFLGFNFKKTLWQDKNVRKAVAYFIDREVINKEIGLGNHVITDFMLHPASWLMGSLSNVYTLDMSKGKQYLEQAGFQFDEAEQVYKADGVPLTITMLIKSDSELKEIGNLIAYQLRQAGLLVNQNILEEESYLEALQSGQYDVVLGTWRLSHNPNITFAFHSQAINTGTNIIGYENEQMDLLLNQIGTGVSVEEMLNRYHSLQTFIQEELPYFSLFFRGSAVLTGPRLEGELKPNVFNPLYQFEDLKLNRQ